MMPPSSAGPGTSWPTSSPHRPVADTDRLSCRGAAVAVQCGTAPGASLHRSRLLHARWRRAPAKRWMSDPPAPIIEANSSAYIDQEADEWGKLFVRIEPNLQAP